ncbi:hypothetical protein [Acinetobacter bereziniae]|uniref:hypothetical protein n=1 Tax=Acinetobacter bereziniae TaxID=106648 RepID=UPI00300A2E5C
MMAEHYLEQTSILPENNSVETIYQKMQKVFFQHGRLLVLLDETLAPDFFDDLKNNLRVDQIIYIPLAKGNGYKDTSLFFIEISDEKILKDIGFELAEHLLKHFDIANDRYLVHGFGASQYDNDELNRRFKKTLVLQDIESKILFRWYDPRVMIYLDQIFNELQLNSLLANFIQWHFIHPTGYYHWENIDQKKLQLRAINKINVQQSLQLDLIEISNTVFRKAHELEQIDSHDLDPQKILKNLYQAHEQYYIKKYIDLLSYGLYAELLGQGFIQHPHVVNVLKQYWNIEPENYNFTEAMNFIAEDDWALIKTEIFE